MGGFAWRVIDNPDYGEGSTYTALFAGYGFIAIRVGDRYVKQVSVPAYKGSYTGVAYARYSSKTKLDICLSILSTSYNDLYKVCRIAYTSAYEEYPAIAWLNESIVTVFFYNSSDRDYYVYFTDLNCNIRKAIKVFDGNTYYKYANEVVSASGRDTALFVYRDVGNDLDVYAAIIWGNGSTSILLLSNEGGDEHLGRNAVF